MPELECWRCGKETDRLYDWPREDEETGEKEMIKVCWDCDWEMSNGQGDLYTDAGEIYMNRWEDSYAYDPVNTPPPPGY